MNKSVYVINTGGRMAGGIELLHQLVDSLRMIGVDAHSVYYPFYRKFSTPDAYRAYEVPVASVRDIPSGARVVLPEIYSYLINRFDTNRVYIWWLSYDNYINSRQLKYAAGNLFAPWAYHDIRKRAMPPHVVGHLTQSEYARAKLDQHGVKNIQMLSDYIHLDYLKLGESSSAGARQDSVAFNPAKGRCRTERIIKALGARATIPIAGMTRAEVMGTLGRCKVYIDFGGHPGKDRIPREAAALGCCVLVNRRGSAANGIDVPIDLSYKIDDTKAGFEARAVKVIEAIFHDYGAHAAQFAAYREKIGKEKAEFRRAVSSIFEHDNQGTP